MANQLKKLSTRKKKKNRAQVSIEYLIIIGLITLVLIPLLAAYYIYIKDTSYEIGSAQLLKIARKIADEADNVYFLGEPTETSLKIYIPEGIESSNVTRKEVSFRIRTESSTSDIVQFSSVNLTGSLPASSGLYTINLKAEQDRVVVSYS